MTLKLKNQKQSDPLKRFVEKDGYLQEYSPMNPPDAYSIKSSDTIPYEKLHPFLQELIDEHNNSTSKIKAFEEILNKIYTERIK